MHTQSSYRITQQPARQHHPPTSTPKPCSQSMLVSTCNPGQSRHQKHFPSLETQETVLLGPELSSRVTQQFRPKPTQATTHPRTVVDTPTSYTPTCQSRVNTQPAVGILHSNTRRGQGRGYIQPEWRSATGHHKRRSAAPKAQRNPPQGARSSSFLFLFYVVQNKTDP